MDKPTAEKPDSSSVVQHKGVKPSELLGLLFGRTAQAAGDYAGELTEAFFEHLRAKREKNLKEHIRMVRGDSPDIEDPTVKQIDQLGSWAEGAQEISSQEKELATFWRATLRAIDEGEIVADVCLVAIKEMNASDAKALIDIHTGQHTLWYVLLGYSTITSVQKAKLIKLGMLHKWHDSIPVGVIMIILISFVLFASINLLDPHLVNDISLINRLAITVFLPFLLLFLVKLSMTNRLTEAGNYLTRMGRKFLP